MNIFLCLFGMSLISVKMFQHFNHEKYSFQELAIYFFLFTLFNHVLSTMVCVVLFGLRSSVENAIQSYPVFAFKYVIVSMVFAFIIPIFFQVLKENIDYRVEVIKVEKSKKKSKKNN